MIAGPEPEHPFFKEHPDLFREYERRAHKINEEIATETRIFSCLIIGAWLGVLLVTMIGNRSTPAVPRAGLVMLCISITYFAYSKWRSYRTKKDYSESLKSAVALREFEEKHGRQRPW